MRPSMQRRSRGGATGPYGCPSCAPMSMPINAGLAIIASCDLGPLRKHACCMHA